MRLLIPEYSNQFVLRYNSVYRQGFRGVQLLLFLKIAVLVSRSGGVISTDNPMRNVKPIVQVTWVFHLVSDHLSKRSACYFDKALQMY